MTKCPRPVLKDICQSVYLVQLLVNGVAFRKALFDDFVRVFCRIIQLRYRSGPLFPVVERAYDEGFSNGSD